MDVIDTIEQVLRQELRREKFRNYSLVTVRDHIVCIHQGFKACVYWQDFEGRPHWSLELAWPHGDSHYVDGTGVSRHSFDIFTVDPDKLVQVIIDHLGGINRRSAVIRL